MPPTDVHFNGSINLPDTETVMREIVARVPKGVSRIPDGETGERQQWVFFQLGKFLQTPGLEPDVPVDVTDEDARMPRIRVQAGIDPEAIEWPSLGYADVYQDSFAVFQKLQDEGTIPAGVRFQVEYPTPLAAMGWLIREDQDRLEPSYERALLVDLDQLLDALPHDAVAVQWDVAVEFGHLEGAYPDAKGMDAIVERLARDVDHVAADVPVGLHLCYGDYRHQHFQEPESLALQVEVVNNTTTAASRPIDFFSFTVPQYQRNPAYFEPLASLASLPPTQFYFALVPYHPEAQAEGTTAEQVRLVDRHLGDRPWGICTECGMGRVEREDIPTLLDLHREILANHA
jgi:hypothetical protein